MKMIKKPTLKDIALEMKISTGAVSRIMNGKGEEINLAPETIRRTQEYAASIGYRPFTLAKNLRLGKSGIIGVCMQTTLERTSDMLSEILAGIFTQAAEESVGVMHFGAYSREAYRQVLEQCTRHDLDGLIVHYNGDKESMEYINELHAKGVRLVMLMDTLKTFRGCRIDFDHRMGGRIITQYLIEQGHRRIAHVTDSRIPSSIPRCEGYNDALSQAGIKFDKKLIVDRADSGFPEVLEKLFTLSTPPTAIFCWNDKTALRAARYLNAAKHPHPVQIAGFDNRCFMHYGEYRFPTVDFPSKLIGQEAVKLLLKNGGDEVVTVSPRLLTIEEQGPINDF